MSNTTTVQEIAQKLREASVRQSRLSWAQYTTGFDFGLAEAYEAVVAILSDKANFDAICAFRKNATDPTDKRKADILFRSFEPFHLSKELNELAKAMQKKVRELSAVLNTHRTVFEGSQINDTDLAQIITNDSDRARRKNAFLARAQVNTPVVEAGFIDLLNMRKEYARLYGASSFTEMQLQRQELHPDMFATWGEEVREILPIMNRVRSAMAEKYCNDTILQPWDGGFVSAHIAPSLQTPVNMTRFYEHIKPFFAQFGFDLDAYNITYDLFSRRNKSEWGYNFPIETAKDSRILANVKDQYQEFRVLLHETGHAVHSFLNNPDEVILNMGISGIITEGLAKFFDGFLYRPVFFGQFFNDRMNDVQKEFNNLRSWNTVNSLRAISDILFDQRLYTTAIRTIDDIHSLYWKTYTEVLGEEPYADVPPWAYRIHHTTHPIYLHNYLMGDIACEMFEKTFLAQKGYSATDGHYKELGTFLYESVIKPSGRYPFPELFERISGKKFSLSFVAEEVKKI